VTRYVLSPSAQADLSEIWEYSAARWGDGQAEVYLRQIQAAIETIAADPRRGRRCDDIRAGYSKYAAGSHVVFYRQGGAGVDVVRVLHQRMDFNRHL
jgi:toxin ParE1/3/4